jgi:hypothetical protein
LKIELCLIERQNEMKKSKFSEEQVVGILREGPSGMAVQALCAKHNISDPTDGKWKQKWESNRGESKRTNNVRTARWGSTPPRSWRSALGLRFGLSR